MTFTGTQMTCGREEGGAVSAGTVLIEGVWHNISKETQNASFATDTANLELNC